MNIAQLFDNIRGNGRNATVDDIRNVFGDYHNALRWLAVFLIGDEKIADTCVVDACNIAQTRGPIFHEWLVHWAARATVRCAFQTQYAQIAELAPTYEKTDPVVEKRSPLSVEYFQLLVKNTEFIRAQLDVLCRFVFVYRGIANDPCDAVAAELGISPNAVERAYSAAFDAIEFVRRGILAERTIQPDSHIFHESTLAASID